MDEYRRANQKMWDLFAGIHVHSSFYHVDEFKKGSSSLDDLVLSEMGEVRGKSLLHLQCHFGLDTLSWARLGARATGMDFSSEGIRIARELSHELKIPARFICCDLYDLPDQLNEKFDRVFTSYGVLCWLSDIPRWAQIIGHFLKPGGVFYIAEFHPFIGIFDNEPEVKDFQVVYPYFLDEVIKLEADGTYVDNETKIETLVEYEWQPRMGEIITSLINAGLVIEFVHEYPWTVYPHFPFLVEREKGRWYSPEGKPSMPLTFTLRAHKAA